MAKKSLHITEPKREQMFYLGPDTGSELLSEVLIRHERWLLATQSRLSLTESRAIGTRGDFNDTDERLTALERNFELHLQPPNEPQQTVYDPTQDAWQPGIIPAWTLQDTVRLCQAARKLIEVVHSLLWIEEPVQFTEVLVALEAACYPSASSATPADFASGIGGSVSTSPVSTEHAHWCNLRRSDSPSAVCNCPCRQSSRRRIKDTPQA